jgi:hypothetical protein
VRWSWFCRLSLSNNVKPAPDRTTTVNNKTTLPQSSNPITALRKPAVSLPPFTKKRVQSVPLPSTVPNLFSAIFYLLELPESKLIDLQSAGFRRTHKPKGTRSPYFLLASSGSLICATDCASVHILPVSQKGFRPLSLERAGSSVNIGLQRRLH